MAAAIALKNCQIVNRDGTVRAGIAIDCGRIVAIARDEDLPAAKRTIDVKGRPVMPGLVDAHVHLEWPPGVDPAANVRAETRACAAGGVTTLVHLLAPAEDTVEKAKQFVRMYEENAFVDMALSARIYTGEDIGRIEQAVDYGIRSFKLLLPYKGSETAWKDRSRGVDDGILFLTLEEVARLHRRGVPVLVRVHCENPDIVLRLKERFRVDRREPISWDEARPRYCEEEALRKCLYLAGVVGCPLYVVHLSIQEGVDRVAEFREKGGAVTVETCIQYLTLNTENTDRVLCKMNPPVRTREDNERLWQAVTAGTIDVVATDHAPVPRELKTDLWNAVPGVSGVETLLPLMVTEGVQKRRIPLEKVVEVCCYNPARAFGLFPRKGQIAVGADADLVVVDLDTDQVVGEGPHYSASGFSPFAGWKLRGWPALVLLRGEVVAENQGIVGSIGRGRYQPGRPV